MFPEGQPLAQIGEPEIERDKLAFVIPEVWEDALNSVLSGRPQVPGNMHQVLPCVAGTGPDDGPGVARTGPDAEPDVVWTGHVVELDVDMAAADVECSGQEHGWEGRD